MIHFPIIKQFCGGFCSVCLVFAVKHLHSLISGAHQWCNGVIHEDHFLHLTCRITSLWTSRRSSPTAWRSRCWTRRVPARPRCPRPRMDSARAARGAIGRRAASACPAQTTRSSAPSRSERGQWPTGSLAVFRLSLHATADVVRKYSVLILCWKMFHVSLITCFSPHSLNTQYKSSVTCLFYSTVIFSCWVRSSYWGRGNTLTFSSAGIYPRVVWGFFWGLVRRGFFFLWKFCFQPFAINISWNFVGGAERKLGKQFLRVIQSAKFPPCTSPLEKKKCISPVGNCGTASSVDHPEQVGHCRRRCAVSRLWAALIILHSSTGIL